MGEEQQRMIFMRNLNRYISESGKKQNEIAKELGISPQRINTWTQGVAIPRMGAVQMLADYFHVNKSDLLEEPTGYYLDPETARKAQELFEDRNMRVLFDAARGSRPQDLQMAADLLRRLKETNPDG